MHFNLLVAAIAMLLGLTTYVPTTTNTNQKSTIVQSLYAELQENYQQNQNMIVVDQQGNQYINPSLSTLQSMSPELFSENRIRVTIANHSEDNQCSTELVLFNGDQGIIGNYSLNICSSFGWIFFTSAECFGIDLYHDAGQEAPYGNEVAGSVDWTFTFNNKAKISGTYFDGGEAKMITVASPCYTNNQLTFQDRRTVQRSEEGIYKVKLIKPVIQIKE